MPYSHLLATKDVVSCTKETRTLFPILSRKRCNWESSQYPLLEDSQESEPDGLRLPFNGKRRSDPEGLFFVYELIQDFEGIPSVPFRCYKELKANSKTSMSIFSIRLLSTHKNSSRVIFGF